MTTAGLSILLSPDSTTPGSPGASQVWCSFCGAPEGLRRVIAGPYVYICEDCVELASEVLRASDPLSHDDHVYGTVSYRSRQEPGDLIRSEAEQFHGRGIGQEELMSIARNAFQRAMDEYVHGNEDPAQRFARRRIREAICAALPGEMGADDSRSAGS